MSKILELLKKAKEINKMENLDEKLNAFYLLNCNLPAEFSHLNDLVSKDGVCRTIAEEASKGNLESITYLLHDVTDCSKDYYLIDASGNYADLDTSEVNAMLEEIIKDLEDECAEELEWEIWEN